MKKKQYLGFHTSRWDAPSHHGYLKAYVTVFPVTLKDAAEDVASCVRCGGSETAVGSYRQLAHELIELTGGCRYYYGGDYHKLTFEWQSDTLNGVDRWYGLHLDHFKPQEKEIGLLQKITRASQKKHTSYGSHDFCDRTPRELIELLHNMNGVPLKPMSYSSWYEDPSFDLGVAFPEPQPVKETA